MRGEREMETAMASGNIKGFYRQKKNKTSALKKPSPKATAAHAAALGSDAVQTTAVISDGTPHLQGDLNQHEEVLRQFDMNQRYGPCLGLTRLARWERAQRLGLNPPNDIPGVLKLKMVQQECLWDGRA